MEFPASTVAVFEENRTRADLYSLWLDEYDVQVASTTGRADEILGQTTVVAVVNQAFADGKASELLEAIRSRAPLCRVLATRDRSTAFPSLDAEYQIVKPVFEEELADTVKTLLYRVNYHLVLALYYRTTIDLSSFEITDGDDDADPESYDMLQRRAAKLQSLIVRLTRGMSESDIDAVKQDITFEEPFHGDGSAEKVDSKYRPDRCSNCKQSWDRATVDDDRKVRKLGAYVWRCVDCGHVQMRADPSHQDIGSYRL